jgi:nitroreductase
MLVAMTYMLGCSSKGLATIPMEGINACGIRKVLKIPNRYAIPLIVSTGLPYRDELEEKRKEAATRRYPRDEVIYGDTFGDPVRML